MNIKGLYRLFLFCVLPVAIAACNKINSDTPDVVGNKAHLSFVNTIPDGVSANLYFNGTRQNGYRIAYLEASGYINVASGQQNVSFKDTTYAQLIESPITFKPDSNYTIYLTGNYGNGVNTINTILTVDNEVSVAGKPKLRFVNASPTAQAVDVYLNSLLLSNKAYKSVSGYARPDSGTVALKVNIAGTATTILSKSIVLKPRSVYTMYAYGIVNQSGTKGFNVALNN
ncbi:DUF4397 domain-containing protein [Mucilaginibacter sp. HMF5004]|uniref:DUF4397 domain-containing protein n=1 Tax=Mucilaginibacter rivuli TaxID=2857527 RepID=UPI001C5FBA3C|nr:DUF4397 domain-containing protein [Mucilaginibacter rivuli]MBW4890880.1 DUF4397 domain-containing protein [Mucilaginibacter rivuli]